MRLPAPHATKQPRGSGLLNAHKSCTLRSANSSLRMTRDYKVSLLRSRVSWQSSDHALPGEGDRRLFVFHAAAASHRFLVAIIVCRFAATIFNKELCGGLAISGRDIAATVAEPPVTDSFAVRSYRRRYRGKLCYGEIKPERNSKKFVLCSLATVYCYLAPSKGGSGRVPAANSICRRC